MLARKRMALDFSWLPLNKNVRVLGSHACGIFALEKPAGTMTHPNAQGIANAKNALLVADYSLKNECYFCRDSAGTVQKIFVLNRLDSPTSGIVLCATDTHVAKSVRQAFREERVQKTYFAIVCGNVPAKAVWKDFLIREKTNDGSLRVKIAVHGKLRGAQFAETEIVNQKSVPADYHLVKLLPKTGRTHQLRVQCAAHSVPILGDKAYGDFEANKRLAQSSVPAAQNRLFLHAGTIELTFSHRAGTVAFAAQSPLPKVFADLIAAATGTPEKALSRFRLRIKTNAYR